MTTYQVFRRGFNLANNPSRGARPEDCTRQVATVEAADEHEAVRLAQQDHGVTVYNGQCIWATSEEECLAEKVKLAEAHKGQVLVKYWRGTTPLEDWCSSAEEIDDCLDMHSNAYGPTFEDAEGTALDYEEACNVVRSVTAKPDARGAGR